MSDSEQTIPRTVWGLIAETFARFEDDGVVRLAAAMSYFLLLAIAPVLLIVSVLTSVIGQRVDLGAAPDNLANVGAAVSPVYEQVSAWAGSYAPYVTAALVLFGAASVFSQFSSALQVIWKTPPTRSPLRAFLRHHGISFALIGVAAAALLVAVVAGGIVSAFGSLVITYLAEVGVSVPEVTLARLVRAVLVFVAAALLFEVAFTLVPDRRVRWRDAVPGALVTAGLFLLGETGLSYYLGSTQRFSVFGTFEFFVILIVWIYYSALVALWGAELTRLMILRAEADRGEPTEPVEDGGAHA